MKTREAQKFENQWPPTTRQGLLDGDLLQAARRWHDARYNVVASHRMQETASERIHGETVKLFDIAKRGIQKAIRATRAGLREAIAVNLNAIREPEHTPGYTTETQQAIGRVAMDHIPYGSRYSKEELNILSNPQQNDDKTYGWWGNDDRWTADDNNAARRAYLQATPLPNEITDRWWTAEDDHAVQQYLDNLDKDHQ